MTMSFDSWKEELLFTGRIVQDEDETVSPDEAHRRFLRYVELLEALDGTEGASVLEALFQSIQMKNDYGAYATALRVMGRFPDDIFFPVMVEQLPDLIRRQPDWAGEVLVSIANGQGTRWEYQIPLFNEQVARAAEPVQTAIVQYIRNQEQKGWLTHRVGVLCPGLPRGAV